MKKMCHCCRCWCLGSIKQNPLSSFLINFSALTVVHFHAPWALQCKQMNEVMTELAKENSHVKFVKVSPIVGKSKGTIHY